MNPSRVRAGAKYQRCVHDAWCVVFDSSSRQSKPRLTIPVSSNGLVDQTKLSSAVPTGSLPVDSQIASLLQAQQTVIHVADEGRKKGHSDLRLSLELCTVTACYNILTRAMVCYSLLPCLRKENWYHVQHIGRRGSIQSKPGLVLRFLVLQYKALLRTASCDRSRGVPHIVLCLSWFLFFSLYSGSWSLIVFGCALIFSYPRKHGRRGASSDSHLQPV